MYCRSPPDIVRSVCAQCSIAKKNIPLFEGSKDRRNRSSSWKFIFPEFEVEPCPSATKKKTQHLSFIFYSRTYLIHSSSPASRFLLFTAIPRTTEHPRFEREKKKRGNLLRQIFRRTPIDLRSRTSLIDYARRYKITFVHRYFSTLFRFDRHSIFDRSTIRKRILRSFAQPIRKSLPFLPLLLFRYHQILDPVIVPFIFRKKIPRVIVVHRFVQIAYSKNSQFKIDHHHRKRDPTKCTVRWSLLISPLTVKTY